MHCLSTTAKELSDMWHCLGNSPNLLVPILGQLVLNSIQLLLQQCLQLLVLLEAEFQPFQWPISFLLNAPTIIATPFETQASMTGKATLNRVCFPSCGQATCGCTAHSHYFIHMRIRTFHHIDRLSKYGWFK